jgi:hypothetical protein
MTRVGLASVSIKLRREAARDCGGEHAQHWLGGACIALELCRRDSVACKEGHGGWAQAADVATESSGQGCNPFRRDLGMALKRPRRSKTTALHAHVVGEQNLGLAGRLERVGMGVKDREPLGDAVKQRVTHGFRRSGDLPEPQLWATLVDLAAKRLHEQLSAEAEAEDRKPCLQRLVDRVPGSLDRDVLVDRVGEPRQHGEPAIPADSRKLAIGRAHIELHPGALQSIADPTQRLIAIALNDKQARTHRRYLSRLPANVKA